MMNKGIIMMVINVLTECPSNTPAYVTILISMLQTVIEQWQAKDRPSQTKIAVEE